ncbi:MAG: hypothetical protein NTY76_02035 [Candidatus Omnitrophica bacterium]|nr:hypothetical protein [Candidatus Omnitrophota bacterium]
MNLIKIVKKNDLSGYRILIIAIAISLAWHIFWLSAVKIVSSPMPRSSVRFSKVAFLGPILTGSGMEVRASPASRGLLERRYRDLAGKALYAEEMPSKSPGFKYESRRDPAQADQKLSFAIDDAVAGKKLEADYAAE